MKHWRNLLIALCAAYGLAGCGQPEHSGLEEPAHAEAKNQVSTHQENLKVVASSRPLYLITKAVMQGASEPTLLFGTESGHHAALAPKQAAALQQADLVVWSGRAMDHALEGRIPKEAVSLDASEALALKDDHQGEPNPHFWFSPEFSAEFATKLAAQLSNQDPARAELYAKNAQKLSAELQKLEARVPVVTMPYVAYHDAFGYIETVAKLDYMGSLTHHDEPIAPKTLLQIAQRTKQLPEVCVLATAGVKRPPVLETDKYRWAELNENLSSGGSFATALEAELQKLKACLRSEADQSPDAAFLPHK